MSSIYNFNVNALNGDSISMSDYEDKVLLIVNTASKCGFTPQYAQLEELYQAYKDKGLVVLGFPSDQFGGQEPLEGDQIGEFCEVNYGVSFPMFQKSEVKGENAIPLYQYLSDKKENGKVNIAPKWNFQKYLVDRNGKVVDYFISTTSPTASRVKRKIEKLLAS